jgi:hypothetical protein
VALQWRQNASMSLSRSPRPKPPHSIAIVALEQAIERPDGDFAHSGDKAALAAAAGR